MSIISSIGKLLFGGSQKQGSTDQTVKRDPYGPTVKYINDLLGDTDALYNGGAPQFSAMEQGGYDMLSKMAGCGTGDFFNAANDMLTKTSRGDFLTPDSNPYIADIAKRISGTVGTNIASNFGKAGRTSGGLSGYFAGKGMGDSLTDFYGSMYNAERGNQMTAAGMAPTFEGARFQAPNAMIDAGKNITARPFDLNQQRSGILSNIAQLGGTTDGKTTQYAQSPGVIGQIVNSFMNAFAPNGGSGVWGGSLRG